MDCFSGNLAFDHRFLKSPLFGLGAASRIDQGRFGQALFLCLRRPPRSSARLSARIDRLREWPPACGSASGVGSGILVPAVLAGGAADLPSFRRDRAVLHHILRAAIRAGEDHCNKSPLPGR